SAARAALTLICCCGATGRSPLADTARPMPNRQRRRVLYGRKQTISSPIARRARSCPSIISSFHQMSLGPGTRFGSYDIGARIGEGGMGVVYRATDARLKRDVAIKVLPDGVSNDQQRLARFQREAEILATLNHPNIAAVYGLEQVDGMTG